MSGDPFQLDAVRACEDSVLAHLATRNDDVVLKIAALRAAADFLSHAMAGAAMATSLAQMLGGRR